MELQNQIGISLSQLEQIQNCSQRQGENSSIITYPFAICLSSNRYLFQKQTGQFLYAKDTQTLPVIPIRRRSCEDCLLFNLQCEVCQKCQKTHKTCCRSLNCIYELRKYLSNKQDQVYQSCECCKDYSPSSIDFSIDWRLLYLLQKLGEVNNIKYNYFLQYKADIFLITEQEIQDNENYRKINRTIFQQSFITQPDFEDGKKVKDQNMISLQGLFQTNVQAYVQEQQNWNQTSIEVSCYQVVQHFLRNKQLQSFKKKLQTPSYLNEHEYTSGYALAQPKKYFNVTESTVKIDNKRFLDLSSAINKDIVFFYHSQLKALAVKNATYEEKDIDIASTKVYKIANDATNDLNEAIWFKDRKGDIFAIHKQFISIFKFHMKNKNFKQIILRQDKYFLAIKSSTSILYISQTDRVYYFDAKNFQFSFYFQLYRPYHQQKEFSNCLSVNPPISLPKKFALLHNLTFIKASYAMQEVILKPKEASKIQKQAIRKQLLPTLYLLAHSKEKKDTLCLYRLIHHQSHYQFIQMLDGEQIQQSLQTLDLDFGIFTIFKKEKKVCICYQTSINGLPTLIQGTIQNNGDLKVFWEIRNLSIQNFCRPQQKYPLFEGKNCVKIVQKLKNGVQSFKNAQQNMLLLNDLAGLRKNNSSRYLVFQPAKNQMHELILNLHEGDYIWSIQQSY